MLFLRCLVALLAFCFVQGATLEVNWTLQGVQDYADESTPLKTNLGDVLVLKCDGFSNLFIQTDSTQYDNCNASAGSGMYAFNGFCLNGSDITLTLTENSRNLMNTVNFENNRIYYFTSYSSGHASSANDQSINYGGQCNDGLKMVVLIGELNPSTAATGGIVTSSSSPNNGSNIIIIACVCVVAGIVVIIVLVLALILCCCHCLKKNQKVDEEMKLPTSNPSEPNPTSDHKLKLNGDGKLKPNSDGKVKAVANEKPMPGAGVKVKPSADSKSKPGANGKPKPGAGGKPKPGPDGKPKPGPDGKPKPGAGGKVKPSADSKPKPGGNGKPNPGADKCSGEIGPKPSADKSDCENDLNKSGHRPRHESKVNSSVTPHSEKAAPVFGASSAVLIEVSASNGKNKRIQLRSYKKITELPQPQGTAGQPETKPTTCNPSRTGAAGIEVQKSTRKYTRRAPPPPGAPQQPKTDSGCGPPENDTGACNGGSRSSRDIADVAKQSKNGTATKVHSINAAGLTKARSEPLKVNRTSNGSGGSSRTSANVTGVSLNGCTSSKGNGTTPKSDSRPPRGDAGPSRNSTYTVHSKSGTETGQHMNGHGAFIKEDKGDKNKLTGSAGVFYRAQEENVNISNQTGV